MVIAMRPQISYFVNREEELQRLLELIRGKSKVLILGLRGYGKTSLVVKTIEEFEKREGKICIYINCLRVYDGKDLLLEAASEFQGKEKLAEELESTIKIPVDIRVIDYAPVWFKIEALNGEVLIEREQCLPGPSPAEFQLDPCLGSLCSRG